MANKLRTLIAKMENLEAKLPKRAKLRLARIQLQKIAQDLDPKKSPSKDMAKDSSKQLDDPEGKKNADPDKIDRFGSKIAQIEEKIDSLAENIKETVLDEKEDKVKEKIVEKFEIKEDIKTKSEAEPDNEALKDELNRAEDELSFAVDDLVRIEKGETVI